MPKKTVTQRLTEVASLKERLPEVKPDWHNIIGVFADDPAFDEAMRIGRQHREAANKKAPLRKELCDARAQR